MKGEWDEIKIVPAALRRSAIRLVGRKEKYVNKLLPNNQDGAAKSDAERTLMPENTFFEL